MNSYKRSVTLLLIFAIFLGTFLSGCSGNKEASKEETNETSSEGKIELDFWTFWGSETRRPIIEKIIEDFNNSQDKIHVKHTYLPWGDIWTKELAAVAAGNPPDVIINDINTVRQRAEKKQNESLGTFFEQDTSIKDQFYPELWNAVTHEGVPYALPFNTDTRLLFWNKELFKEAGLDPEQPPKTWKEVKEFAKKIDQKAGKRFTRIGFLPRHKIGPDIWMLNATGNGYWDYEAGKPVVNDEKAVDALQWVYDLEQMYGEEVINGFKAEFGENQADPFISGKIGMVVTTPTDAYTKIRDFGNGMKFGVAPMPEMEPGNGQKVWGGGFVAEVPYGAKNPEASWEFIKYLTGPKAQEYWAVKNFDNVANIEASENAAKSSELKEDGKMVYQTAIDNMEHTILTPTPLEAPDYLNSINPELDKALLGEKTPKDALKDAQKAVEQLVESTK
ncbi:ABC transporter substrate-binding protein [Bacillus sp. SA1-12]|uniref:ABC transporter substrate-binding protein n=1 Tax=Bacillus sp. SA1-12 TaxID=1455638 RepID=UPI000627191C|nr:ABC transporter substrate-binding protein [Bacillus sp. SA1-12]KKI90089.1 ABC transporter substrate-binding protein [Bacillus sp. SA1-12]